MPYATKTYTQKRPVLSSDGRGGKTEGTPATIATGLTGTRNYYSQATKKRTEIEEGMINVTEQFIRFDAPGPALQVEDILEETGGKAYSVRNVRVYDFTVQADVEVIE